MHLNWKLGPEKKMTEHTESKFAAVNDPMVFVKKHKL